MDLYLLVAALTDEQRGKFILSTQTFLFFSFNIYLFHGSVPLLYILKTSKNQRFSEVLREHRNETLMRNGLKMKVIDVLPL